MKKKSHWCRVPFRFALASFFTVVSILIVEGVLQLVADRNSTTALLVWPPNLTRVFNPAPGVMPGIDGVSFFRTNSIGLRGDELDEVNNYRLLTIGGSTTECLYLDQQEAWPMVLQYMLNGDPDCGKFWVGNAGMSGKNIFHNWVLMKEFPFRKLRIDTVIIMVGVNDLSRRLSVLGDYNNQTNDYLKISSELFSETFVGTAQLYPDGPFFKRSILWQKARNAKSLILTNNFQDDVGRVYVNWRQDRRDATVILEELPDLSSAIDEYEIVINKIVDVSIEREVRLIFLTQPSIWRDDLSQELEDLLWFGHLSEAEGELTYYSSGSLESGLSLYNEALLRICRARGIECIDIASMLEKDTSNFYDDVHFNESGSRRVAKILSEYLLNSFPFAN